jgi:hypothetical protein
MRYVVTTTPEEEAIAATFGTPCQNATDKNRCLANLEAFRSKGGWTTRGEQAEAETRFYVVWTSLSLVDTKRGQSWRRKRARVTTQNSRHGR